MLGWVALPFGFVYAFDVDRFCYLYLLSVVTIPRALGMGQNKLPQVGQVQLPKARVF